MLILGLETSAKAASVALCRDGELLGLTVTRTALTHSQTVLPMAEALLRDCALTVSELNCVAVAHGPGSFTGVRIGVATAKGLCWAADKGAVGVSTLEAMACLTEDAPEGSLICPVMDARRAQVYNALFERREGQLVRLTPDRAIAAEVLCGELAQSGKPAYILGDGTALFSAVLAEKGLPFRTAPELSRWQNAWGVCLAAMGKEIRSAEELLPVYLRLSQAERERQARLKQNQ